MAVGTLTWTRLCNSPCMASTTVEPQRHGLGYNGTRVIAYGAEIANTDPKDITGTFDGVSSWSKITTATIAPTRVGFLQGHHPGALAFDGVDLISFGGLESGPVVHNQTWKFVDATPNWVKITPTHSPAKRRTQGCLASDGTNVVLAGGYDDDDDIYYDDTWIWTNASGDWDDVSDATRPPARFAPCFGWDPISGRFILFGGLADDGVTLLDDTWAFTVGVGWEELFPTVTPVASFGGVIFYEGSVIVMFTGGGPGTPSIAYVWKGTDWEQPTSIGQPSDRSEAAACFSTLGLLAGGDIGASTAFDTWTVTYEAAEPPSSVPVYSINATFGIDT